MFPYITLSNLYNYQNRKKKDRVIWHIVVFGNVMRYLGLTKDSEVATSLHSPCITIDMVDNGMDTASGRRVTILFIK